MRGIIGGMIVFAVAFGLYLFLAGSIETIEIIAAVVCATAATGMTAGLAIVAIRRFRFAAPFRAIWRPLAAVLPETFVVGRELARVALRGTHRQCGDFVYQPFDVAGTDPTSHGRRALSVLGVSLAPQSFVIRGEGSDVFLLHTLPAKPPSSDTKWPI